MFFRNQKRFSDVKRISVQDVADEAGVAIGSVSRALNGHKHVSAELRARVQAAADKLGYSPHAQARSLRLGRSNTIGLLINHMRHPMYSAVVAAVESELSAHGQMLLLANAQGEPLRERSLLQAFERSAVDGAIVTSSFHDAEPRPEAYAGSRLPLVLVDLDMEGLDRVFLERRESTRGAMRYLLSLGHRRVALFTPALDRVPGGERLAGYADALRQANLRLDMALVPTLSSPLQDGFDPMLRLLETDDPPTALICLATPLLAGALRAVRRKGLKIPRDFSVIAIGAPETLELAEPSLTCLKMDLGGLGRHAVRMLMRRLAKPNSPVERVELQTELLLRDSCGPARMRQVAR